MIGVGSALALLMLATPAQAPARAAGGAEASAPADSKAKPAAKPIASAAAIGSKWGIVTSILRSPAHNRAVGGAPNSFHLHGRAIDIARRPGVAHAEIEAAYRRAGFRLIESLDEGDHSHFAFALPGSAPVAEAVQLAATEAIPANPCVAEPSPQGRRRPDRWDGCSTDEEPKPKYRPIEESGS